MNYINIFKTKSMKRKKCLSVLLCCTLLAQSQIHVNYKHTAGSFVLSERSNVPTVVVAAEEETSVKNVADIFARDVQRVTSSLPVVKVSDKVKDNKIVIIGTLGKNKLIDKLVKQRRLDISRIKGGWEQYAIKVIDKPFKGVEKALVIVGSDRRGTAYGALSISEKIGVSPYYWWADVPVEHHSDIFISGEEISNTPSVKYRGLFINDEDWGLKPWSTKNFEKNLGDIGPKTYAKVCELILRLRGNMLAPAMHTCTGAFYSHPEKQDSGRFFRYCHLHLTL
jgi:S-layer like family, C-terminal region.